MPLDDFQPARVKTCSTAAWGSSVEKRTDLQLMNFFWALRQWLLVTCAIKFNITPTASFVHQTLLKPQPRYLHVGACDGDL